MAKKLTTGCFKVDLNWETGVHKIGWFCYDAPTDTVDAAIVYKLTGTPVVPSTPRVVDAGELAGTFQTLIDALRDSAETAEGIA
jgi:hypothetical protein